MAIVSEKRLVSRIVIGCAVFTTSTVLLTIFSVPSSSDEVGTTRIQSNAFVFINLLIFIRVIEAKAGAISSDYGCSSDSG